MNSLLIVLVALVALTSCRHISRVGPGVYTNFGEWGIPEYCPEGSFAIGFMIKQEEYQGSGDDTATNGIRLICDDNNRTTVTSSEGDWGTWHAEQVCRSGHRIRGFTLKAESYQYSGDDTAVNGVGFLCTSGETFNFPGMWGTWRWWNICPDGRAICGIKTQVEKYKSHQDDVALSDMVVYCCPLI